MTLTKEELFQQYAPSFNFEHGPDELVKIGLERGFITKVEGKDNLYLVNENY